DRPLLADGLLAGLVAAFSLVALWYARRGCEGACEPGGAAAVALVAAQSLPQVWRRRYPLTVSLVTGLATAADGLAPYPDLARPISLGGVIGLYSVAAWGSRRAALLAGAIAAAVLVVVLSLPRTDADLVDAAFVSFALAGAWLLGDRARVQRALAAELAERAVRLERERAGEAQRAVASERARIARELHDVVAHHVSMMVVQAEAGPVAVEGDPARAAGAFEAIAATGRQALVEMRRLLGVLRGDGDGDQAPSLAPQPGLADVGSLVEQVGRAGLRVELVVEGPEAPLPAGVDLSAYRIVQEALTNAVKHGGPGRARVLVRYGEHDLEVQVQNGVEPPSAAAGQFRPADSPVGSDRQDRRSGQGLVGMRERVNLFGGDLRAGPGPDGGFTVDARLPLGAPGR
ncbi:MAG TPA: histidine kinase, partial [Actinomycetota bacterium]|nr:histidine kinase [Actinomycetota bacterium]